METPKLKVASYISYSDLFKDFQTVGELYCENTSVSFGSDENLHTLTNLRCILDALEVLVESEDFTEAAFDQFKAHCEAISHDLGGLELYVDLES